jgi:hypothetical protein
MNIKLTKERLEALHVLLNAALHIFRPTTMSDMLLNEIVDKVNDRIASKLRKSAYDNRVGYGLKLNSVDARALYIWYQRNMRQVELSENFHYESIVANEVMNQIERQYG